MLSASEVFELQSRKNVERLVRVVRANLIVTKGICLRCSFGNHLSSNQKNGEFSIGKDGR